ncbi:Hypothetical predicted protein [Octopus vulgaris]|uniref:Uncharacterized protein n=1 Tax=Octopus vulgaris TaxID=6645 RepID=A0AA36ARC6_OCTVU|nr:Hypothetical predicted protein [Octopus vulgaris]
MLLCLKDDTEFLQKCRSKIIKVLTGYELESFEMLYGAGFRCAIGIVRDEMEMENILAQYGMTRKKLCGE